MPPTGSSSSSRRDAGRSRPSAARELFALAQRTGGDRPLAARRRRARRRRLAWRGEPSGSPIRRARRTPLEDARRSSSSTSRPPGCQPATVADLRDRRPARRARSSSTDDVRDARQSRRADPGRDHRDSPASAPRDRARRAAAAGRRCDASLASPATPCSSPTTHASTWRSSTGRSSGSPAGGSRRPSSTRSGSPGALLGGRTRRVGLAHARPLLRHVRRAVSSRAPRRPGDGRDPAAS